MFHFQHEAHAVRARVGSDREREKQPSAGSETVKPGRSNLRRASVDKDRVGGMTIVLSAISLQNLNMIEMAEIVTRTRGQLRIYLDASDVTVRPNYFGDNPRVVTDTAFCDLKGFFAAIRSNSSPLVFEKLRV